MAIRWRLYLAACLPVLGAVAIRAAAAEETDCGKCHGELTAKPVVHAAVQVGCKSCHSDLDAAAVPHKSTVGIAKGLATEPPGLCQRCHDNRSFEGHVTHAPAAAGLCLTCHDPHASEHAGLLRQPGAALCLACHSEIGKRPHVTAEFSGKGHPVGDRPKAPTPQDPLRPGRPFYCGSCHEPHRADYARLMRFDTKSTTGTCQKCHRI